MSELFLTASMLPVPHGFSIRRGGASLGPFSTLNLALGIGDPDSDVRENLSRLGAEAGFAPERLATVAQVHGNRVVKAEAVAGHDATGATKVEADALWTDRPAHFVGVRTADCVPILLADPTEGRVAAVHSGWKGTASGVVAHAVDALKRAGSDPARLLAAIGPSIGVCCYEVSQELADGFDARFGPGVVARGGRSPHLNLRLAVQRTLVGCGVSAAHIELLPHCTRCDGERFFSFRRDGGVTGRHLAFIAPNS